MSNETLIVSGFGILVALQSWILLEIISMRERVTRVETKVENITNKE